MVTPVEIGSGARAFKTVVDLARQITELGKKAENAELIRLIAELNLEVAHANMALAEVTNELATSKNRVTELEGEIQELEQRLNPEAQLQLRERWSLLR